MTTAIKIENVSKLYRLGTVGTGTIAHDLNRWWHTIRGKEDPYAKVGQVNDRTKRAASDEKREASIDSATPSPLASSNSQLSSPSPLATRHSPLATSPDYVWALKDINLEVAQGEILGIIGRNGAGKSTLLKLLSRVTAPTAGSIKTKGRIASLLEVGTGFHPEMTGRENIYMNGAILGMRRNEITRQLDEIVEFSGCAKYLDTPVKRYSSGMTVRLGFAVAAHLQCEILIVDEVLAVGDSQFQHKCLGRMRAVANGGRTVLFVSHNLTAVRQLTNRAVVLNNGLITVDGDTVFAMEQYLQSEDTGSCQVGTYHSKSTHGTRIASITTSNLSTSGKFPCGESISFQVLVSSETTSPSVCLSLCIIDTEQRRVCHFWKYNFTESTNGASGSYELNCSVPRLRLFSGRYFLRVYLADRRSNELLEYLDNVCQFEITIENLERDEYPFDSSECLYIEDALWTQVFLGQT
jgi:lipopolysaccharide transport system ATP-binding protein